MIKTELFKKTYDIGLNTNVLKVIAITSMFIDHSFRLFMNYGTLELWGVHFIGRLAAPIICYLVAEGHHYSRSRKKYIIRLFLFALVSHFPYIWYFDLGLFQGTSVIWTLTLGLIALTVAENKDIPLFLKGIVILLTLLLAVPANWHYLGVLWILVFGIFRSNFKLKITVFIMLGLILYVLPGIQEIGIYATYRLGFLLTIPLLYFYNNERGKQSLFTKWAFYVFYPGHLLILFLIKNLFIG